MTTFTSVGEVFTRQDHGQSAVMSSRESVTERPACLDAILARVNGEQSSREEGGRMRSASAVGGARGEADRSRSSSRVSVMERPACLDAIVARVNAELSNNEDGECGHARKTSLDASFDDDDGEDEDEGRGRYDDRGDRYSSRYADRVSTRYDDRSSDRSDERYSGRYDDRCSSRTDEQGGRLSLTDELFDAQLEIERLQVRYSLRNGYALLQRPLRRPLISPHPPRPRRVPALCPSRARPVSILHTAACGG